jgi:hypothetical protein
MKFLIPLGLAALFVVAWTSQGWAGIAMVGGGVVMWALLHFTRMLTVLKRAADRPKGWVDSAVMLNAKLSARRQPAAHHGADPFAGRAPV